MEDKYQEEESIGKELDSIEVLNDQELESAPEPLSRLDNIDLEKERKQEVAKKTKDPKVTPEPPIIIVKPGKKKNKLGTKESIDNRSNEPEPEDEPESEPTPIPPVIIIKPFKKK